MSDVIQNDLDDVGKYRKKSAKCTPKKSNHKHVYQNCLYVYDFINPFLHPTKVEKYRMRGSYCIICGKIHDIVFLWSRDSFEDCTSWPLFYLKNWPKQKYIKPDEDRIELEEKNDSICV